jgi:hypothetical protein
VIEQVVWMPWALGCLLVYLGYVCCSEAAKAGDRKDSKEEAFDRFDGAYSI